MRASRQAPGTADGGTPLADRPSTILLIEPHPYLHAAIRRLLEARGFDVVAADSIHDALRSLDGSGPVGLVIVDADAWLPAAADTVADALEALSGASGLLFISDDRLRPLVDRLARKSGASVIRKPISLPALERAVEAGVAPA